MNTKLFPLAALLVGAAGCASAHVGAMTSGPIERTLDTRTDSVSVIAPPTAITPPMMVPPPGQMPPETPPGGHGAAPDAQMQAVLGALGAMHTAPLETLRPVGARSQPAPRDGVRAVLAKRGIVLKPADQDYGGVDVADRTIPGPGGPIPVRIYTPEDGRKPFPVIVYYHGGGWVIADRNAYDDGARGLSKGAMAIVISVDYRQGPEHKFPAAHDDALAAYQWAISNAGTLGGDQRRIALAGESAGGGLAVATAMQARDKGLQAPVHVVSVYPIAQGDTTTPSYVENAYAKPLSRGLMSWFFNYYTRTPADRQDPRIDLGHAHLRGLPPTTIINAQIDPLRDDGMLLEQALRAAGVPVERRVFDGVTHEFFGMSAVVDKSAEAQRWASDRLKQAFGQ